MVKNEKIIPAHKNTTSMVVKGSRILFKGSLDVFGTGIDLIVVIIEKYAPQAKEEIKTKISAKIDLPFKEFKLSSVTK